MHQCLLKNPTNQHLKYQVGGKSNIQLADRYVNVIKVQLHVSWANDRINCYGYE